MGPGRPPRRQQAPPGALRRLSDWADDACIPREGQGYRDANHAVHSQILQGSRTASRAWAAGTGNVAAQKLRSAEGAFDLLQNFKNIESRKAIHEQMMDKFKNILQQFGCAVSGHPALLCCCAWLTVGVRAQTRGRARQVHLPGTEGPPAHALRQHGERRARSVRLSADEWRTGLADRARISRPCRARWCGAARCTTG